MMISLDLTLLQSKSMAMTMLKGCSSVSFSCRTTYKHPTNQAVTNLLVKEVQGNKPAFAAADIRGMCLYFSEFKWWIDVSLWGPELVALWKCSL